MEADIERIIKPCNIAALSFRLCNRLVRHHHGIEKAITLKKLAAHYKINYRRMQSVVTYAVIKERKPIGTSTTGPHFGVYWISCEAERQMVVSNLKSRVSNIFLRINALTDMPLDQIARQAVMDIEEAL